MIALIKSFFAPPVFDEDDEKTRIAALLNTILLASFVIVTLYMITRPLLTPEENPLWALLRYPMIVGSWVLLKRGNVRAACIFFVVTMWLIQMIVWGGSGGLQQVSIAGIIIRVLITGLLLGGRAALLFAALSLAENAVIMYAISRGFLPRVLPSYTATGILIEQGVWSILAAVLLSLSMSSLNQALRRARDELTERKRTEDALRRSEERYRLIVENQTEFIVKWLPDGTRTFVNESYCRYFGLSEEDCIGSSFIPLVAPEFRDMLERKLASITPENPQVTDEHISFVAGSEQRWQRWTDRGIFDTSGKLVELQSTGRDITERKCAEDALRSSEERFSKAFNGSPTPMAIHSFPDVRYLDVNDAFVSAGEFTREQVIGRTWSELNVWANSEEQEQVLKALRELNGRVRNMEARFRCKGGEVRVGEFSSDVITLDGKECLLSVVNDITERKQAEEKEAQLKEAIHKSAIEWRRTFDSVESVLIILDLDGRIIRLNRAAKELSGLPYEEIIGRAVETFGSDQPWKKAAELVNHIRESRRTISTQTQDEAAGTSWDISSSMLSGFDNRIIVVARDITRMVKLQESLRRSETMSAMGALVAGVAHEVRNPLFIISATLDTFESRFGEREEYQKYINILRGELNRLNDLMRDLLEYGKPLELELTQGSIGEVVTYAIRYCEALVKRSNVEIINRVGNDLPQIKMDRKRVVQVFRNVIENAIQHSAAGAIVRIEAEQIRHSSGHWINCRICDSGQGFRAEELAKIFEPFFTRRRGGTGIGLSIVQRVVEEHGGKVTASNHPDGGAVVELRFQAIEA